MKKLASLLICPSISILSYQFEKHWLDQCKYRLIKKPDANYVSSEEKAKMFGTTKRIWSEGMTLEPSIQLPSPDSDIWAFEHNLRSARKGFAVTNLNISDSISAKYIGFTGDSYAYITDTHKLIIANAIISTHKLPNLELPECVVADIKIGDFIVFPESGDRDLIREIADKLLGERAHKLRSIARMWKDTLKDSKLSPHSFLELAKRLGQKRHILTIINWFTNITQIGPKTKDDLILIALVTESKTLELQIDSVWDAISYIRGAHLSAGNKIRDMLIQQLSVTSNILNENGSKINLSELGSVWIVQVENIANNSEPRDRSEVNRLLWA